MQPELSQENEDSTANVSEELELGVLGPSAYHETFANANPLTPGAKIP